MASIALPSFGLDASEMSSLTKKFMSRLRHARITLLERSQPLSVHDYAESLRYIRDALVLSEDMEPFHGHTSSQFRAELAMCYFLQGDCLRGLGQVEAAKDAYVMCVETGYGGEWEENGEEEDTGDYGYKARCVASKAEERLTTFAALEHEIKISQKNLGETTRRPSKTGPSSTSCAGESEAEGMSEKERRLRRKGGFYVSHDIVANMNREQVSRSCKDDDLALLGGATHFWDPEPTPRIQAVQQRKKTEMIQRPVTVAERVKTEGIAIRSTTLVMQQKKLTSKTQPLLRSRKGQHTNDLRALAAQNAVVG